MDVMHRRMIPAAVLAFQLLGAAYLGAQTDSVPWPPPPGKVVFPQHTPEIGTLDDLIKAATLIVDSTVSLNLPTVDIETKDPGAVETDSLFAINQVIRGTRPAAAGQMLLTQLGGNHGPWEVSVTGDPLVKPRERYIFFLVPDWRAENPKSAGILPDKAAVPRYMRTGAEYGQALIDGNGTVQFSPTAAKGLHQYDGMQVSAFVKVINDRIAVVFPTPPPYPVGVTPRKITNGNPIFPQ